MFMNTKNYFTCLVVLFISLSTRAQDTLPLPLPKIRKALCLYPIQKQLGYRSNLHQKWFTDFKGGMTFSALPFFTLEINRNKRFVNKEQVKVYTGIGLTFDSFVPGVQVPFGMELVPLEKCQQLSIIAEVKPKMSLGPVNFVNISFSPHIGIAYYFKYPPKA